MNNLNEGLPPDVAEFDAYMKMLNDLYHEGRQATTLMMEAEAAREKEEDRFEECCRNREIQEAIKIYRELTGGKINFSYMGHFYNLSLEYKILELIEFILDELCGLSMATVLNGVFVEEWCDQASEVVEKSSGKKGVVKLRNTISSALNVLE